MGEYIFRDKEDLTGVAEEGGKLIRCKDCKFSFVDSVEPDGVEAFRACKLKRDSESIYGLWVVSDEDFCSWAEKKRLKGSFNKVTGYSSG